MHELIHSLAFKDRHAGKWLTIANQVNRKFGYRIKRLANEPCAEYNLAMFGVANRRDIVKPVNYIIGCTRCNRQFKRQKMSAVVQRPQNYRCGCGGKLERIK